MNGQPASGRLSAKTEGAAREQLESMGLVNLELSRMSFAARHAKPIPSLDLSIFSRQMAVMMTTDISLQESIIIAAEQTQNPRLQGAIHSIAADLDDQFTIAQGMRRVGDTLPEYMINMVSLGESSGTMDDVFTQLADYYEKEHKLRRKVRSAATYPLILTVLMAAVVVLLITRILPMFNSILSSMGGEMPGITSALLTFGTWLGDQWLWVVLGIAVVVVGLYLYGRSPGGRLATDRLQVRLPLFRGVFSRIITVRFARALALLLRSGVTLFGALEMMDPLIENLFVRKIFMQMRGALIEGETQVSDGFKSMDVFPQLFIRMVAMGEKTGGLDSLLTRSAALFDDELDNALERLTTLIEPILVIVLAAIVGVILLSLMLPMIDIMNAIG